MSRYQIDCVAEQKLVVSLLALELPQDASRLLALGNSGVEYRSRTRRSVTEPSALKDAIVGKYATPRTPTNGLFQWADRTPPREAE